MKILKNNYNEEPVVEAKPLFPRIICCNKCSSELEYDKQDLTEGLYGAHYITCPLCGEKVYDYEYEGNITVTPSNVKFPTHFYSFKDGVNVSNERIQQYIQEGIQYLRNDPKEFVYNVSTGNMLIVIFRQEEEHTYNVIVSKDYYDTYIDFQKVDFTQVEQYE